MLNFSCNQSAKMRKTAAEFSASEFIPYVCHWNHQTLLTKKKELLQVIKIGGFSFETADDEDLDIKKNIRNLLLKGMASANFLLYFHMVRRKHSVFGRDGLHIDPNIEFKTDFPSYVDHLWHQKHASHASFVNELYITIVRRENTKGIAYLPYLYKKFMQGAKKTTQDEGLKEAFQELEEMSTRILNSLREYEPELLGTRETPDGLHSELLEFFGKIVNCGNTRHTRVVDTDLSRYISTSRLFFGRKSIEIRGHMGSKYAGIVSVKEYGPTTHAGMFDRFLQLPFEYIMTQSFSFTNRQSAISKMQIQQNRMIQAEDKAISQIAEITEALDLSMSGTIAFGEHHLTILCIENSLKGLDNALSMASVELANCGINSVRETRNLEMAFWAQLPANFDFTARKSTINTLNLASFCSLHNYPPGKATGNHWGDAVTVFDTTSSTPFFFNFHVRDVGHTTIIGPTGAGKTVLMNFLCAQAQKFKCRMFFFDKDRGAEIFIRAIGGEYTVINPGSPCYFNPLLLPDTPENRTFLLEWLTLLVTANGEPITTTDIKLLDSAIVGNYKLQPQDRMLRNVAAFLGVESEGSLASRLAMWYGHGSHARVFDNAEDRIDMKQSLIFGFEMGELLRNKLCLGPVLSYIFHRINISLDGTPSMIVLDEAWALIDNPIFAPKIKDWLKVLRKLNTFVIFATQSVEDASKSAISDTLIQQTATQIFLPNLKATDVYRTSFMLSQREFILIKTTDPGSRFFLVKQGINAVVARIDLGGMEDVINVLSGRSETVLLLDKIRAEYGNDPEKWLPIFYQRVKEL